jgi:hypothetical protein
MPIDCRLNPRPSPAEWQGIAGMQTSSHRREKCNVGRAGMLRLECKALEVNGEVSTDDGGTGFAQLLS